jgi:hypothetical protein
MHPPCLAETRNGGPPGWWRVACAPRVGLRSGPLRPPKEKWAKTADAIEAVAAVVQRLVDASAAIQKPGDLADVMRSKVRELVEHVDTSEECEQP